MTCVETETGTDVSFNQHLVNFKEARTRDGIRLAFIRWSQLPWLDSRRVANWLAAGDEPIFRGIYVVYDAGNEAHEPSGHAHAMHFIQDFEQQIGAYNGELQIWVDLELEPLDWDEVKVMCDVLSAWSGRLVGIYTGAWFLRRHLPLPPWILNHDFWLTGYDNECGPDLLLGYNLNVRFWQRTNRWRVPWVRWDEGGGIVDRTDWLGTLSELRRYTNMAEKVVRLDDAVAALENMAFDLPDTPVPPPPPPPEDFKLLWPTPDPKVVTQWYGINPQWYSGFGLPGHEGLDLRAFIGVEVYAAAAGKVIRAETVDNNPYGIHVRLEHKFGQETFKTVYGHFKEVKVQVDQEVNPGQLIGIADDTGNSNGSHLHFTLKHVGHGSPWMNTSDIVNPVPYIAQLFPRCTIQGFTGNGWRADVGGNFRSTPDVGNNLIRWIPAGATMQALDFGGDGGDWWKASYEGTVGWFWNPGYKLSAL